MDKIKDLPVFRMFAFAVALAIILGLSSAMLSFTASAETTNDISTSTDYDKDITLGFLKNYSCLKLSYSSEIDYLRFRNIFYSSSSPYVIYSFFGVKADGKLSLLGSSVGKKYVSGTYNGFSFLGIPDSYYSGEVYKFKFGFYNSDGSNTLWFSSFRSNFLDDKFSVYGSYFSFDKSLYSDFYMIYSGVSNDDVTTLDSFNSDIILNIVSSDYKDYTPPPTGGSDNGRFTCFGNYTDYSYDEHLSDLISESIEYTKSVSYGNYGRGKCYFIKNPNDKDSFIFNRPESKQLVRYNSTDISFTFYNATDDLGSCSIRLSATMPRFMERESDSPLDPIKFLSQHAMSYYHFNRIAVISSDSLKAIPAKSTVTATLDLTGFTSIAHSGYYLIELVNSISGDVVSSVMFDYENDGQSFKQNNDNIDVKFKYDNGNISLDVDLPPDDTGHINGIPDGGLDSSNNKYTFNYQNPNITDIFGTLDDSINSISDFFQMCFSLLPLAISTIIIGGFALLVLLRVLGR